jgi:hypothetical protein
MISENLMKKIKRINSLIKALDKNNEKSNSYSFEAMRNHIEEIKELFLRKDEHWKAETMDLLIHCLLLLDRNACPKEKIKELFNIRCRKFEEKIVNQLKSKNSSK